MKRMLLFLCLLFIMSGTYAQFQAGQKLLGGQLSFSSNSGSTATYPLTLPPQPNQRFTSFGLSLSLSRFKSPTVLTGGGISYAYFRSRYNVGTPSEQTTTTNLLGAFINKTKLQPLANKLYLSFTGTGYGNYLFGTGSALSFFGATPETKTNTYMLGISGSMGLMYQLNQHFLVSCELSNLLNLSYSHSDIKYTSGGSTTKGYNDAIGFSTGLSGFSMNSLSFGVRYLFKD